jgi:hypothetical protein
MWSMAHVEAETSGRPAMKTIIHGIAAMTVTLALAGAARAHGDKPHPKCNKGYEPNDAHKWVRKP